MTTDMLPGFAEVAPAAPVPASVPPAQGLKRAAKRSRKTAKDAGTKFETAISRYLASELGDDRIERRARTGGKDRGDIGGVRVHGQRMVIEAKNVSVLALPKWTSEAHTEAGNDDALVGVVVHKRHGIADPGRQWVSMTVDDLLALMTGEKHGHRTDFAAQEETT